jgi:hypothetical protein
MKKESTVPMSRTFLLGIVAILVWGSMGAAVLLFIGEKYWPGIVFFIVAIAFLFMAVEGSIINRLIGRSIAKTNLVITLIVLAFVAVNEISGMFGPAVYPPAIRAFELVFTIIFVILILFTAYHVLFKMQK